MGIISIENTDRLFWLGRYTERVYTTLRLFADSYDHMIDMDIYDYEKFCHQLDIPCIYTSKDDFCLHYCFNEKDPNSIYSNLIRAYDNAIVLREAIGSEPLSYIQLAIYDMNMASVSKASLIELQHVIDNLLAFWGIADDSIDDDNVRNIIKTGKRVERIDLYGRLHASAKEMQREVQRLSTRLPKTCLSYRKDRLENLFSLVQSPELNYYKVVEEVNCLLED